jgi:DNA-binding IclR family transcriptional regulator
MVRNESSSEAREARTSLARALRVLAVVIARGDARADELAREVGLPVSTVYRYLRDLREAGFVADRHGRYRPGERIAASTRGRPSRTELRRLARPTLERLAAESGETALILVRNGSHALCLDQVESHHAMRMAFRVGQILPLYAGAASRVLLAYAPPDVREAVLAELGPITPATPDAGSLAHRLESIRTTGIVTSRSELVPGAIAISAPVLSDRECLCAIAVAGPDRRGDAAWQRRAKVLVAAARGDLEALV